MRRPSFLLAASLQRKEDSQRAAVYQQFEKTTTEAEFCNTIEPSRQPWMGKARVSGEGLQSQLYSPHPVTKTALSSVGVRGGGNGHCTVSQKSRTKDSLRFLLTYQNRSWIALSASHRWLLLALLSTHGSFQLSQNHLVPVAPPSPPIPPSITQCLWFLPVLPASLNTCGFSQCISLCPYCSLKKI